MIDGAEDEDATADRDDTADRDATAKNKTENRLKLKPAITFIRPFLNRRA